MLTTPYIFIFAIGSYYTSFPHGKDTGFHDHFRYFEQGLYFSRELSADRSVTNVWILLVQCFFLLAVCHTDRYAVLPLAFYAVTGAAYSTAK